MIIHKSCHVSSKRKFFLLTNKALKKFQKKFNETFRQFEHLNEVLSAFSNGLEQFDDLKRLTANLSVIFAFLYIFFNENSNFIN